MQNLNYLYDGIFWSQFINYKIWPMWNKSWPILLGGNIGFGGTLCKTIQAQRMNSYCLEALLDYLCNVLLIFTTNSYFVGK